MRHADARRMLTAGLTAVLLATAAWAEEGAAAEEPEAPPIASMSALAFTPDGVLLVGDGRGGAVWALELGERQRVTGAIELGLPDVETQVAALLGARAEDVVIHDLAVDPLTQEPYLAVSRNRGGWDSPWKLPNDLGDADELVRIDGENKIHAVDLAGVEARRAALPNPVDPAKDHYWKQGIKQRADAITDLAWDDGVVWVAGLSNEEFASALWKLPYPFDGSAAATTVEIFHGAHGKWETWSPIRALVPYEIGGRHHLLAAYLCTPLVTFDVADLVDGAHVRGRTVAEFGSGNYPLDMVVVNKDGADRLVLANSNLPMLVIDPKAIEAYEGAITEEVEGYTAGVAAEYRSGIGTVQMDRLNDQSIVTLQRTPGGRLQLLTHPVARF